MLKERTELIRQILYAIELAIVCANYFALYFFISRFKAFYALDVFPGRTLVQTPVSLDQYLRSFWLALLVWAILLRARDEYHHLRIQSYWKLVRHMLRDGFLFFCWFAVAAFALKFHFLSRFFLIAYTVSTACLLLLTRVLVLSAAYYARRRGYNYRNLLLVGTGRRALKFLRIVNRHREWGYRFLGLLDKDPGMRGKKVGGLPVLGTLSDLPKILEDEVVDEVVFVVPRGWLEDIEKCILHCESVGVPATLSTDFFNLEIAQGVPKEMGGFTYLTFETNRLRAPELLAKRAIDVCFSAAALAVLSPVFIAAAALVKTTSKGPVFFRQVRSGRNGRQFTLYKFRSMVEGAEAQLESLREKNEMTGPVFKMTDDPRLTPVGKFLRQTSIDELPQFWNVLKGDMSIVGPRPPLPSEVEKYETWQRRRLSMKPGLTCIWQVSGRNKIGFADWMKLDLQYIDRWSLGLDLRIILMTARAILARSGR